MGLLCALLGAVSCGGGTGAGGNGAEAGTASSDARGGSPAGLPDGAALVGADSGPPRDGAIQGDTRPAIDGNAPLDARLADGPLTSRDAPTAPGDAPVVVAGTSPVIAGCPILPSNHIFNTPINNLPVHANSAAFMATVGVANIHLDLGRSVDMTQPDTYYGIPYNVVNANSLAWRDVKYTSMDPDLSWDPKSESDCASGAAHTRISPCTTAAAPGPQLPIPANPLVEGGISPDVAGQTYADHHILILDTDNCRLWEIYHAYTGVGGVWNIFGSATFDLRANTLRPSGWTSADAAGFPILPLLLRADEAASGSIKHALRFTIRSRSIRNEFTWPARHLTENGTLAANLPPMGQLFRLKASYVMPANFGVQARAIVVALQTYGMYLADGGSNMYIQGEPSANWSDTVFSQVQSVGAANFEAVDLGPIQRRPGFNQDSGAVPP